MYSTPNYLCNIYGIAHCTVRLDTLFFSWTVQSILVGIIMGKSNYLRFYYFIVALQPLPELGHNVI